MKTRAERALVIRPYVERLLKNGSLRDAAKITGVSVGALRNLVSGSTPQEETLVALEGWVQEALPGRVREPPATYNPGSATPSFADRLIEILDRESRTAEDRAAAARELATAARLEAECARDRHRMLSPDGRDREIAEIGQQAIDAIEGRRDSQSDDS